MKIKEAKFVTSNTDYRLCPEPDRPEYAFIGRSNVGKSSLINMLTDRKNLAKTSQQPGKTQLINHFMINDSWYLVDLPGYGYAKVSKTDRESWQPMIDNYLRNRPNLVCTFVLIDSRHDPQRVDLEFMEKLGQDGVPFHIVFTKVDKLKKSNQVLTHVESYKQKLLEVWEELPPIFVTSSEKGEGREALLETIENYNLAFEEARSR
ncbi:ribosome biogenesis GTP-binding protein YihA/YsxC [Telluribacter sp. SYSU D00476]|uniref:ribosome biogenesis GTP-binding protein YihA/YsxC n=1 Tax=Telluribacter sp. SYSU D00476 TaxID=2811430 RepID=UPI001FF5362D|nr:ribosome biogenesis GTP-binding protein YihA/YsxC [Telluribacter sp. SYSU D00476]